MTALRQVRRMAPEGWWRTRPFLPLPSSDYLHFRLLTQYADPRHRADAADVLNYLTWCKRHG
jgi:hypothetical protein